MDVGEILCQWVELGEGGLENELIGFELGHGAPVDCRIVLRGTPLIYRDMAAQSLRPVTKVMRVLGARLSWNPAL